MLDQKSIATIKKLITDNIELLEKQLKYLNHREEVLVVIRRLWVDETIPKAVRDLIRNPAIQDCIGSLIEEVSIQQSPVRRQLRTLREELARPDSGIIIPTRPNPPPTSPSSTF